jgi:hypothetical protein
MIDRMPILVLAGSDRAAGPTPQGLEQGELLTGYKGAIPLPGGRCLAQELVERLRQSDRFEEPILVGPRHIYDRKVDVEIVDVTGNLATTLRCVRQFVRARYRLSSPVAVTTCDILPAPDDIRCLMETCYAPDQKCMFWGQLVEARPKAMGASAWKPSYQLRTQAGQPPKNFYPGHLVIARPAALRMRLTNHLLQLAYRYRNWDMRTRHVPMVVHGLGRFVWEDLRNLASLRLPTLTLSVPYYCLRAYYRYRHQQLTVPDFEHHVGKVFLHRDFQGSAEGRPVVFALTGLTAFAKDIDTRAELEEIRLPHENQQGAL